MRQLIMLAIRIVSIGVAFSGNIPLTVACMALQSAASSLGGRVTAARRALTSRADRYGRQRKCARSALAGRLLS
jgi:hypothetical protein